MLRSLFTKSATHQRASNAALLVAAAIALHAAACQPQPGPANEPANSAASVEAHDPRGSGDGEQGQHDPGDEAPAQEAHHDRAHVEEASGDAHAGAHAGHGHDHGVGDPPILPFAPTEDDLHDDEPDAATTPVFPPIDARPEGRLIDAHAHLAGYRVWPEVQSVLDEVGIDYILNLSGGSPRRGQTLAMMLAEDSGGRVLNLMTIDWEGIDEVAFGDTLAAELELLVNDYGYVGLKVSKALGLYARDGTGELIAVDDPRLFPLWEKAGELGVPVFIHTSDPLAFWDPITPENERYAELSAHPGWSFAGPEFPPRETLLAQRDHLLALFPDTTFVGVHFANNPEDLEYVARTLDTYPNFYVDIAARVPEIGRHDPERVRELFVRHQDRILFATDIAIVRRRTGTEYVLGSSGPTPATRDMVGPFFDAHRRFFETDDRDFAHPTPIQGDWTIDGIDLPDDVLDKVYYLNAYRLVLEGRRSTPVPVSGR